MDALAFLRFIPNRAAGYISKVLASAVANAANNHNLNPQNLKLVEARVDEGPRMKRVQPRAQGRAYRILKRMSHITVVVQEVEPKPRKPRKVATRSRAQEARQAKQAQTPSPAAAAPAPSPAPEVTTAPVAEETIPAETAAVEETTPVENTAASSEETTAPEGAVENTAPEGPQEANTEDTTDETGAPAKPEEA
jgi:large subunit ribosomal protein L22